MTTSPSLRETVLFTHEQSALTSFDVGMAKNKYDLITGCLNKTAIDWFAVNMFFFVIDYASLEVLSKLLSSNVHSYTRN